MLELVLQTQQTAATSLRIWRAKFPIFPLPRAPAQLQVLAGCMRTRQEAHGKHVNHPAFDIAVLN